jgi:hypothetical protein
LDGAGVRLPGGAGGFEGCSVDGAFVVHVGHRVLVGAEVKMPPGTGANVGGGVGDLVLQPGPGQVGLVVGLFVKVPGGTGEAVTVGTGAGVGDLVVQPGPGQVGGDVGLFVNSPGGTGEAVITGTGAKVGVEGDLVVHPGQVGREAGA